LTPRLSSVLVRVLISVQSFAGSSSEGLGRIPWGGFRAFADDVEKQLAQRSVVAGDHQDRLAAEAGSGEVSAHA